MSDIARGLDVSVVTVSKVLRNQGNISAATRKRVLQRAKKSTIGELDCAIAGNRRTFTIGLLLPDIQHPFFPRDCQSGSRNRPAACYHVIISLLRGRSGIGSDRGGISRGPESGRTDSGVGPNRQRIGVIQASSRAESAVSLNRPSVRASGQVSSAVDNEAIGKLANGNLIAQGCRRIAHFCESGQWYC